MTTGYLLLLLGLVAFGMLGIFHKVADHPQCRPKLISLGLLFWGAVLTTIYTILINKGWSDFPKEAIILNKRGLVFPKEVLLIGSLGGVIASLALFVFQTGL